MIDLFVFTINCRLTVFLIFGFVVGLILFNKNFNNHIALGRYDKSNNNTVIEIYEKSNSNTVIVKPQMVNYSSNFIYYNQSKEALKDVTSTKSLFTPKKLSHRQTTRVTSQMISYSSNFHIVTKVRRI